MCRVARIHSTSLAFVAAIIVCCVCSGEETGAAFDSFGGNTALKGEATGFFHLEEINGCHYLITPEGHGYRALGINHFHMMTSRDYDGTIQNIKNWGFNAGCYQGPRWMWDRYPYTKGINLVPICQWMPDDTFGFRDVFDPDVLEELEGTIRAIVAPQHDNAMLIGYFWTDIPLWTRNRDGQDWITFYKGLPDDSPGGRVWGDWKAQYVGAADSAFLAVIAKHLYAKAHAFIRAYDRNHLIFGDRYYESDIPGNVVREALPYIDAIAVQPTSREFNRAFFDGLYAKYAKPFYIADHVSSFATEAHRITMSQAAQDAASYGAYYERYVTAALSHPHVVGYNKCQYQDQLTRGMLKQGLLKLDGTLYDEVIPAITSANQKALNGAYAIDGEE